MRLEVVAFATPHLRGFRRWQVPATLTCLAQRCESSRQVSPYRMKWPTLCVSFLPLTFHRGRATQVVPKGQRTILLVPYRERDTMLR